MQDSRDDIQELDHQIEILERKKKLKQLQNEIEGMEITGQQQVPGSHIGKVASRTRRLLNLLIDVSVIYGLSYLIGYFVGFSFIGHLYYEDLYVLELYGYVIHFLVFCAYYVILEYATDGRTIGKLFTGTRAVTTSGKVITGKHALIRTFGRLIPFESLSFLSKDPIGVHDSIANTKVVNVR